MSFLYKRGYPGSGYSSSESSESEEEKEKECKKSEFSLLKYIYSNYKDANPSDDDSDKESLESARKKTKPSTNVVLKTIFKEFYLHEFFAKRSGLLERMIDSDEKDAKPSLDDSGRIILDLTNLKSCISNGKDLTANDVKTITKYLYTDELDDDFGSDFEKLTILSQLAQYFELPGLKNLLQDNMSKTCQVLMKFTMGTPLIDEDLFTLLVNDSNIQYPEALVHELLLSKIPLFEKVSILENYLISNYGNIKWNKEVLTPFENSIGIFKKDAEFLFQSKSPNSDLLESTTRK